MALEEHRTAQASGGRPRLGDDEGVRDGQRRRWAAAAPGWARFRDELEAPTRAITERMASLLDLRPGQRVLDLASGAGDPAITLAGMVGPAGYVLGLDICDPMVALARAHASERGVRNAEFRAIESELDLGVDPDRFDRASCRAGLPYMPDPGAALAELRRALTPGGRCVAGAWGPPERLQAASVPFEILSRHLSAEGSRRLSMDEAGPGSFAIPTEERLRSHFEEAGFDRIETLTFEVDLVRAPSPERAWEQLAATDPELVTALASLSTAERRAIDADGARTLRALYPDGRVGLGGEHLLAVGVAG